MTKTLFVTPDYTSAITQCRTLRTPNNAEWLGVFNKALLLMLDTWNWEQINDTDLTVEETIAAVSVMLEEFWATETCGAECTLPGLYSPPFRLGLNGRFEMLNHDTGQWGDPTGDYAIPPTAEREEATADERKCLAAANTAHVIGLVYEAITDEIALGGDTLQIAAAMVAALVTLVGGWIAAPVYAIIQLLIALFAGMVELLQALGADVWTTEYDEHLKCVLYNCATDTASVVTFDMECIRANLYEGLDLLSPTFFYDAQIFAQVLFIIEIITMDGLNAAGATTAITSAECACDNCDACTEETDQTSTHIFASASDEQGLHLATEDWTSLNGGTVYVRSLEDGGTIIQFSERCVRAVSVSVMYKGASYPSSVLHAAVNGVDCHASSSPSAWTGTVGLPVAASELMIYLTGAPSGGWRISDITIYWCEL